MNTISTLLGTPLAQAIGWALLHLLWQGVLVAAILAATLALLSKQSANARYLASCGALALLVVLGAATAYRSFEGSGELGVGSGSEVVFAPAATSNSDLVIVDSHTPLPTPHPLLNYTKSHLPQIVLVWLTGVLLLSVRLLFGWLRAHSIAKKNATEAAPEWQRSARRLAHALRLRRAVQLLESAAVEVPTVIGWLRPVVLLPATSLTGLSTEQMEMILAHELAHIRRNDFFVNLMQAVVETLLFYHPAVWWISNRIRVEREHCCDDVAVSVSGKPLVYARALTRLEELRVEDAQAFVAANGGSLIGRIRRLAGARAESPNAPSRFVAGAALLTVLLALIIAPSLPIRGQQQKADTPTPKPQASQTTVDVKADNAADEENISDDPETPEADDMDDNVIPTVAPRIAGVAGGIPGGIAGGVADGVAGGIADGISEGISGNTPMIAPMAFAPAARAIARVAPRLAMRALANINLDDLQVPDPPDPPDAPTPRPDRHRRRHIGEGGKLTVDDLIELRASGVTPVYIDTMRSAGLGELSLDEIAEMRAVGVTPEYLKSLRDAGIKFDSARNVTELRAIGVTGEYLSQMRAAGYGNLTTKQLSEMRAMGVTPSYVKQMSDAGYSKLTPRELVELRAQGIRPEFIKSLNDAGYTNLSVKDLVRMAAMGVNADFIRDLAKYKVK
ncbi:MAG TPA: M56 family metallopeptidase [Thermoanaerobaculia bacterium]|nr:M56 family metallopeptidase [Thermoanaerobaculia bacterium]